MRIDTDQTTLDRWLAAEKWVEFAPGVECCKFYRSGQHEYQSHRRAMCPPADWEADQECETCDDGCDIYACCVGTFGGSVTNWDYLCDRHREHQGFHDCDGCCHDCNGTGLQRHPVTVPCHHRRSTGRSGYLTCSDCKAVSEPGTGYKWRPFPGRITVAWATVEWGPLPVVNLVHQCGAHDPHVYIGHGNYLRLCSGSGAGSNIITQLPPDIDPHTLVGQWARGGAVVPA